MMTLMLILIYEKMTSLLIHLHRNHV